MAESLLDARELGEIINRFNEVTEAFGRQVDVLQNELRTKNEELQHMLIEVDSLKNYFANTISSIGDGVIAIDLSHNVIAFNSAIQSYLIPSASVDMKVDMVFLPEAFELGKLLLGTLTTERSMMNHEVILASSDKTLSVTISPIRNEKGEILGAVETVRDLTTLKNLEMRAARNERLAALGEMAAGVAHEIRNPLGGIALFAQNLQKGFSPSSREHETAGRIISATERLNRIVTDMLMYARNRPLTKRKIPVGVLINTVFDLAGGLVVSRDVRLRVEELTGSICVSLDVDQMTSALLNIVQNGIQAAPPGGEVLVRSELCEDSLMISVFDNGPGIPLEMRDKIFNPFFTTRKDGTGFGLTIAYKIIQDHGGILGVQSNHPSGTIFKLQLPMC